MKWDREDEVAVDEPVALVFLESVDAVSPVDPDAGDEETVVAAD